MSDFNVFCCLTTKKKQAPLAPVKQTQVAADPSSREAWEEEIQNGESGEVVAKNV